MTTPRVRDWKIEDSPAGATLPWPHEKAYRVTHKGHFVEFVIDHNGHFVHTYEANKPLRTFIHPNELENTIWEWYDSIVLHRQAAANALNTIRNLKKKRKLGLEVSSVGAIPGYGNKNVFYVRSKGDWKHITGAVFVFLDPSGKFLVTEDAFSSTDRSYIEPEDLERVLIERLEELHKADDVRAASTEEITRLSSVNS